MSVIALIAIGIPVCLVVGTFIWQVQKNKPKRLSRKQRKAQELEAKQKELIKQGTRKSVELKQLARTAKEDLQIPLKKHHKGLLDWDSYDFDKGEIKENKTLEFYLPVVPAGVFWDIKQSPDKDGFLHLKFRHPDESIVTLASANLPIDGDPATIILGAAFLALELADKNHSDIIDVYVKRPKKTYSEFEGQFE